MTFLAPLYALGAFALVAPVLAHLIRRQPRGSRPFSSLMFLQPTPPRLTRRSRLDQWPLLLLRCLILLLIAIAFTRPLWRHAALTDEQVSPRQLVLAIDTSASMRDANVWADAVGHAKARIAALDPDDHVGLVTFDREARVSVTLSDSRSGFESQNLVVTTLDTLRPSWEKTSLADALLVTLECFAGATRDEATSTRKQVILISDMADAGLTERVASIAWPEEIPVDVYRPQTTATGNAFAQVLPDEASTDQESVLNPTIRVRVTQSPSSESDRLSLSWRGSLAESGVDQPGNGQTAPWQSFQLPAGQSRILQVPFPVAEQAAGAGTSSASQGATLALSGDATLFDNQLFVCQTPPLPQKLFVLTAADPDDSQTSLFYLQSVPLDSVSRTIAIELIAGDDEAASSAMRLPIETTPLVVFDRKLADTEAKRLHDYVENGGRVLALLSSPEVAAGVVDSVNLLSESVGDSDANLTVTESTRDDYALLSGLDYQSQLLSPFAGSQYSDFSKIRFWSHRRLGNVRRPWQTLAEFDAEPEMESGSGAYPAIIQRRLGKGMLWVMAAGWQPEASQLALSSKFVPLILGLVGPPPAMDNGGVEVGDPIPGSEATGTRVVSASGDVVPSSKEGKAVRISRPGIYRLDKQQASSESSVAPERWFAVNVAASESAAEAVDNALLERAGIPLGSLPDAKTLADQQRQKRDRELEQAQKLWQGLLVAALLLLAVEAYWSMRSARTGMGSKQTDMETNTMEPAT
ncbi:MAG: BatA domain-containing protein [Planctomycetota bacterium]